MGHLKIDCYQLSQIKILNFTSKLLSWIVEMPIKTAWCQYWEIYWTRILISITVCYYSDRVSMFSIFHSVFARPMNVSVIYNNFTLLVQALFYNIIVLIWGVNSTSILQNTQDALIYLADILQLVVHDVVRLSHGAEKHKLTLSHGVNNYLQHVAYNTRPRPLSNDSKLSPTYFDWLSVEDYVEDAEFVGKDLLLIFIVKIRALVSVNLRFTVIGLIACNRFISNQEPSW